MAGLRGRVEGPTAAEMELWNAALSPSHDEWVKQISDLGFPAQKFLDRLLELIDEQM